MCDPLSVAGAALSGASMLANQSAANKVAKARSSAMAAERTRQQALQQEADALNAGSQDRYKNFGDKESAKAAELAAFFNRGNTGLPQGMAAADGSPTDVMPSSDNTIVSNEVTKQTGAAKRYGDQQGDALGKLRGFGDALGDNSRLQARDAAQIGTIGGFMRGSSGVLPFELEAANNKGAGAQMLGTILGGAGGLGISAGLGGASDQLFGTRAMQPLIGPMPPGVARPSLPTGDIIKGSGSIYSLFTR